MTKKDFELIAKTFKRFVSNPQDYPIFLRLAKELCVRIQQDNPRFNRERFLTACGFDKEDF